MVIYVTFGQCHRQPYEDITLDKDIVLRVKCDSKEQGLSWLCVTFGVMWGRVYDEEPDMSYYPRGFHDIDCR